LGGESAPGAVRPRGSTGSNRLQSPFVNVVVVGGGAWGTAFARYLRSRDHEVTLAARETIDEAPYEDAELVAIAVPSHAFSEVLGRVRGSAPVLSLVEGLGLGDNAKAALSTRGLVEMARLGEALGAEPETFSGLAGMGDLIVTCWHPSGRNRRAGELIARGATPEEAKAEIGQVVE